MKRQNTAYLHAVIAVFFWSTAATAFKISLRTYSVLHLLLISAAASTLVLFVIAALSGWEKRLFRGACRASDPVRIDKPVDAARGQENELYKQLVRLPLREYGRSALLGFLNPFLYYIILLGAYSRLPAQEAQALNYTWPIVLALLSIPLLGQRLRARDVVAILVSFSGVVIIATRGNPFSLEFSDRTGLTLALGSTVVWSLYWILNTKDQLDGTVRLFLNFVFGLTYIAAVTLPIAGLPPLRDISALGPVYVGLFEMGVTFVFWLRALKLSETTAAVGNLIYFAPFLSLIFIQAVAGEQLHLSSIAGLTLIIGGVVLRQFRSKNIS